MGSSSVISLINNAALLLALGLLFDLLGFRPKGQRPTLHQFLTGVILGSVGIAIMLNPWEFGQGVVFDTRSVLLCISGFFFGTLPTILAVMMTVAFRLLEGGAGAWTGVAVIVTSGGIGLAWRHLRRGERNPSLGEFYLLGLAVHVAMLLWMLTLPWSIAMDVLIKISLPVMLIHPAATAVLGKMMANRESRKRAEKKLRESEERFRLIAEASADDIWQLDLQGQVTYASRAVQDIFGYTPEEALTLGFDAFFPEKERERAASAFAGALAGEKYQLLEFEGRRKDGSLVPIEVSVTPLLHDDDVIGVQGIARDTSERKQAEEKLRRSEAMLARTENIAHVGSWEWDIASDTVTWSDELFRIFQLEPAEKAPSWAEHPTLYHPEDMGLLSQAAEKAVSDGTPYELELRAFRKDGETRLCLAQGFAENGPHGRPVRLFGSLQDITEQHRLREELREKERQLRNVVENSTNLFYAHSPEHVLTYLSPQVKDVLGYTPEEAMVRWTELATENPVNDRGVAMTQRAIDTGQTQPPYELELRHKSGRRVWLDIHEAPVVEDGKTVAIVGSATDVTARKQAEEELRESETRLAQSQQIAKVGSWQLDLASNRLTWSDETYRIFGSEPHAFEATYEAFLDAVHPDDRAAVDAAYTSSLAQGSASYEIEHRIVRSGTGEVRHVSEKCLHERDESGEVVRSIGMIQDITERVEKELEYEQILKTALDGFWLIDSDGRLLEVNASAAGQLGYTPEEMIRLTIQDIDATETSEETRQHMQLLKEEGSVMYETLHRRKDGRLIDVEVSASYTPVGGGRFVAFTRDITERKRGEREDQLNKARLEIIHKIATMPEATEKDICDFVLESMIDLTESAIGFLGFLSEDEEIMQIHAWSTSAMAECAIHEKPIEFPIAKAGLWGEPVRNREPILVNDYSAPHPAKNGCPEGHVRISRFLSVPVFEGDRIVAVSAVGNRERPYSETDVRQLMLLMDSWWEQIRRKRAVLEKEVLQSRLQQAQKMESIGTLAGGIAHDFNNILSIILGNTEMAMHDLPEWSPAQESLKEAREASLRARDLVTQMLLFARQKEQTISNLRVEPIAKESLKMLRASIPATIEIREDIQEGLPPVLEDASQIQQIIMNLCTNAAQVMEENGGRLDFRLDAVALKGALDTFTEPIPEGRYVRMSVRDNGPGIAPEHVERIFDPFFTTKGVGEGTGLGLAVVHGIVQGRHGGITVKSEPGKGTTFSVYLPASKGRWVEETANEASELPKGTECILFVDDEPMIMKLGQRMLERLGYEVESCASGTEALESFRENPDRFDLVLTDMTMPGLRGDKLAEEMLKIRNDIPIIMSTGYSKLISKEKAEEIGVRDFVMKPLTQKELANTVRKVMDEE